MNKMQGDNTAAHQGAIKGGKPKLQDKMLLKDD
ncbi:MAG: hypothetical protein ACI96W_002961 [Paraglaciecola sp.]|jgi:hypothetical protein